MVYLYEILTRFGPERSRENESFFRRGYGFGTNAKTARTLPVDMAPLLPTRELAVFTVFFGQLPPWLPLTLQSMAFNPGVTFIVIGDAAPPALLPPRRGVRPAVSVRRKVPVRSPVRAERTGSGPAAAARPGG